MATSKPLFLVYCLISTSYFSNVNTFQRINPGKINDMAVAAIPPTNARTKVKSLTSKDNE